MKKTFDNIEVGEEVFVVNLTVGEILEQKATITEKLKLKDTNSNLLSVKYYPEGPSNYFLPTEPTFHINKDFGLAIDIDAANNMAENAQAADEYRKKVAKLNRG